MRHDDRWYMRQALVLALEARRRGEVPVGALVLVEGVVAGRAHNASIARTDPTAHAEVLAIRDAASRIGNYRLVGATLYCTVEPCLMCLGAAMHARIGRVVFGAPDAKIGAIARLEAMRHVGADFNHRFETVGGIEAEEASRLLLEFFRERRPAGNARPLAAHVSTTGEVPKWS